MLKAVLQVEGGKHHGRKIEIDRRKFLLGREDDCQLRPNSELISRHHCVFTVDDYAVRLRDLGSTNGTQVNGERIRGEVVLKADDTVSIGQLAFRLLLPGVDADAPETTPETTEDRINLGLETAELSSGDTMFEIPVQAEGTETATSEPAGVEEAASSDQTAAEPSASESEETVASPPVVAATDDTTVLAPSDTMWQNADAGESDATQRMTPANADPQAQAPQYQQQMPAGAYPPPPMYYPQQQTPYPQFYPQQGYYPPGQYPPPGQFPPGQHPQQTPYPQYPGYDPQQYQPAPGDATTDSAAVAEEEETGLEVRLPPPESTGVRPAPVVEPEQQQDGDEETADAPQKSANPSDMAADIIRGYRHRRPKSGDD